MRIFVLGDSFACDLYKTTKLKPFRDYLENKNIFEMKWFTDWLVDFGYEIHNFGTEGCSMDDIVYQFGQIDMNFNKNDRILIWLTNPERFNWLTEDGWVKYCLPGYNLYTENNEDLANFLYQQNINRDVSLKNGHGYLSKKFIPFLNYLINMHSIYKPIVVSHSESGDYVIEKNKYFFDYQNVSSKIKKIFEITISKETNGIVDDFHFGRSANCLFANLIDIIIKSEIDGNYNQDDEVKMKMLEFNKNFDFDSFKILKKRLKII